MDNAPSVTDGGLGPSLAGGGIVTNAYDLSTRSGVPNNGSPFSMYKRSETLEKGGSQVESPVQTIVRTPVKRRIDLTGMRNGDKGTQLTASTSATAAQPATAFDQGVQITPMAVALGYGVHEVDDDAMYVFSVNGVVKVLDKRELLRV